MKTDRFPHLPHLEVGRGEAGGENIIHTTTPIRGVGCGEDGKARGSEVGKIERLVPLRALLDERGRRREREARIRVLEARVTALQELVGSLAEGTDGER